AGHLGTNDSLLEPVGVWQQPIPPSLTTGVPSTAANVRLIGQGMSAPARQQAQAATQPPSGAERSHTGSLRPEQLTPIRQAYPRQGNEKNAAYARRLDQASRGGQAGAQVNGQPLTLAQLAALSGAMEFHLRQDPQLVPLPAELAPIQQ